MQNAAKISPTNFRVTLGTKREGDETTIKQIKHTTHLRQRRQVVCLLYTIQQNTSCKQVACDSFRQKLSSVNRPYEIYQFVLFYILGVNNVVIKTSQKTSINDLCKIGRTSHVWFVR